MKYRPLFLSLVMSILTSNSGCATIPEGQLQLGPHIVRDMHESRVGTQALNKGRPIYIEARSYPQMLDSGDIWAGGPVLLNLGREDLLLEAIMTPENQPDGEKAATKAAEGKTP